MKDRPAALRDADIRSALLEGWGIDATAMRHVPLGGGSYHWGVEAADERRWFVSATDLDRAPWLGADRSSSWQTLRTTMRTAVALRDELGLGFVLAPVSCRAGEPLRLLGHRYGLVVHPFLDGACGEFGAPLDLAEMPVVLESIATLHATPAAAVDLHPLVDLGARALLGPADPSSGPILARYDELCSRMSGRPLVITHGEPHAGNIMRVGDDTYLIDWDTAALALPERDLWLLLDHGNRDVLGDYEAMTGHTVEPAALAMYRLRWAIEELVGAVREGDADAIRTSLIDARAAAGL